MNKIVMLLSSGKSSSSSRLEEKIEGKVERRKINFSNAVSMQNDYDYQ